MFRDVVGQYWSVSAVLGGNVPGASPGAFGSVWACSRIAYVWYGLLSEYVCIEAVNTVSMESGAAVCHPILVP